MEIVEGKVSNYNGHGDIYRFYGKIDGEIKYYFLDYKPFANGNMIASSDLVEAIDSEVAASHIGLVDHDGNVIIPLENKCVKPISGDIILVERINPLSQNILDAIAASKDPKSAPGLVSVTNTCKTKVMDKIGGNQLVFHNQLSEASIFDINGHNLVNNEYFSFIGVIGDKVFLGKNMIDAPVVEYSMLPPEVQANAVVEDNAVENNSINVENTAVNAGQEIKNAVDNVINDDVVNSILENTADNNVVSEESSIVNEAVVPENNESVPENTVDNDTLSEVSSIINEAVVPENNESVPENIVDNDTLSEESSIVNEAVVPENTENEQDNIVLENDSVETGSNVAENNAGFSIDIPDIPEVQENMDISVSSNEEEVSTSIENDAENSESSEEIKNDDSFENVYSDDQSLSALFGQASDDFDNLTNNSDNIDEVVENTEIENNTNIEEKEDILEETQEVEVKPESTEDNLVDEISNDNDNNDVLNIFGGNVISPEEVNNTVSKDKKVSEEEIKEETEDKDVPEEEIREETEDKDASEEEIKEEIKENDSNDLDDYILFSKFKSDKIEEDDGDNLLDDKYDVDLNNYNEESYDNDSYDTYDNLSSKYSSNDDVLSNAGKVMGSLITLNRKQKSDISRLNSELNKVNNSSKAKSNKIEMLEGKLDVASNKVRSLDNKVSKLDSKVSMLSSKVDDQKRLIESQTRELNSKDREIEELRKQLQGKDELAKFIADAQSLLGQSDY